MHGRGNDPLMPFWSEEFDLSGVRTYPLKGRKSKARAEDFARPTDGGTSVGAFVDALPDILAAADLKAIVRALVDARGAGGIVWGLGAHVVKTGLGPVIVNLMEHGFVSAIATTGATVIHDFEIHWSAHVRGCGRVARPGPLRHGRGNGTAPERRDRRRGVGRGPGIGQAVTEFLAVKEPQFARQSILASAARLRLP